MITKYFALPFTKKFQLKQASPRPRGYFQICFAYESLPNLNIKHHLVFGNEKKTNKLQNVSFLFKCYLFWCIFRNPCTACNFFSHFFPLFLMLECSQVGGVRETEAHNRTGRRQLALLHTRVAVGVGELEVRNENQRRYVQPPLWTGNRAAAIWWPVMPPNATYFSCFFYCFFFVVFFNLFL